MLRVYGKQIMALAKIQLTNWRWSWVSTVMLGMLIPIGISCGLSTYAMHVADNYGGAQTVEYAVIGGIVFALAFDVQSKIANNTAFMKCNDSLSVFAVMGISKICYTLGTFIAFFLLSIPSCIVAPLVIWGVLPIQLHCSWLLIPVMIQVIIGFSCVGFTIGALASTMEQASTLSNVVSLLFLTLGSVALPAQFLPHWLMIIGRFNPAVWAQIIIRRTLFIDSSHPNNLILGGCFIGFTVFSLFVLMIGLHKLPWRFQNT